MRGKCFFRAQCYLHHEQEGVTGNEEHHQRLERRAHNNLPNLVLQTQPILGHVPLVGFRLDGKVDA